MKRIILGLAAILCCSFAFAQIKSGIATFTVPAGWKSSQQGGSTVMEYSVRKGDTCRIQLLKTEDIAISSKEAYLKARKTRSGEGFSFSNDVSTITRSDKNGIVCHSSQSTADPAKPDQRYYVYAFSNKAKSFFVLLYCNNINSCKDAMNHFLSSILVDTITEDTPAVPGTKTKRKKAAPGAPAAPAPVM